MLDISGGLCNISNPAHEASLLNAFNTKAFATNDQPNKINTSGILGMSLSWMQDPNSKGSAIEQPSLTFISPANIQPVKIPPLKLNKNNSNKNL